MEVTEAGERQKSEMVVKGFPYQPVGSEHCEVGISLHIHEGILFIFSYVPSQVEASRLKLELPAQDYTLWERNKVLLAPVLWDSISKALNH